MNFDTVVAIAGAIGAVASVSIAGFETLLQRQASKEALRTAKETISRPSVKPRDFAAAREHAEQTLERLGGIGLPAYAGDAEIRRSVDEALQAEEEQLRNASRPPPSPSEGTK